VANEHVRIALTRNGTADTVLISTADLESLEETIAVLSNTEAVAAMEAAVQVLQSAI
jgi:PHD/YefM family antitoxin component YafN of YafNO toxin-antitoxin module